MSDRCQLDAAPSPRRERLPVERKTRRWRFERERFGREVGPHIPQLQWVRHVRVLDGFPVPREAGEDLPRVAVESQLDQSWMVEQSLDDRNQRSEHEPIADDQRRWHRPQLGDRVVVPGAKRDGDEPCRVGSTYERGQPDLHGFASRLVLADQAGGQRCGIVCDHEVTGSKEAGEVRTAQMLHAAVGVDGHQSARRCVGGVGGDHVDTARRIAS